MLALICLAASAAAGQQAAGDEKAVRAVVLHWQEAWTKFDASVLAEDFTDDADWQNAFGVKHKGRTAILTFMTGMFKRPNVQGRRTTWDEPKIRFLRPDVAVAYRDYRTVGHKALDGTEMPQRNTHSTWVLTKDGGKWRIASQIISDDVAPGQ